jgi:hypothetical protein
MLDYKVGYANHPLFRQKEKKKRRRRKKNEAVSAEEQVESFKNSHMISNIKNNIRSHLCRNRK